MTNKPVIQSIIDGVYQDLLINPNGGNVSINTEYSEGYQLNVNGTIKSHNITINSGTHNNVLSTDAIDGKLTLNGQPLGARIYKIDELLSGTFSSEDISNSVNAYVGKNLLQRVTAIETTGSQPQFNGIGFVKVNGSTVSYDNSTYYVAGSTVDNSYKWGSLENAFGAGVLTTNSINSILAVHTNGYAYKWNANAIQGFLGLGSSAYTNTNDHILNQNSSAQSANMWISGVIKTTITDSDTPTTGAIIMGGSYVSQRIGTDKSYNVDVYNSGNLTNAFKINQSGAATFASTVTAKNIIGIADLDGSYLNNYIELHRNNTIGGCRIQPNRDAVYGGMGFKFLTTESNADEITGTYRSAVEIDRIGNTKLNSTTQSLSPSTGALVLNGGIGINGRLSLPSGSGWVGMLSFDHNASNGSSRKWFIHTDYQSYGDFAITTQSTQSANTVPDIGRFYISPNGNTGIGYISDQGYKLAVNGTLMATGTVNTYAGEGIRMIADAAYLSGYNSANTVRQGYLQFTGNAVYISAESGTGDIALINKSAVIIRNDVGGEARIQLQGSQGSAKTYYIKNSIQGISNTGFSIRNASDGTTPFYIDGSDNSVINGSLYSTGKITANDLFLNTNSTVGNSILINASGANYGAIQTISSNSWGLGTGGGGVDRNINNTALIWDINKNITTGGNINLSSNTNIRTIWGGVNGGCVQILSDPSTINRWVRMGVCGSTGDFYAGLSITNDGNSVFSGTVGATQFNGSGAGLSGYAGSLTANSLMNSGGGGIQSSVLGQGYNYAVCVREPLGQGGNTAVEAAPRLGFHWGGIVASSISIGTNGSFYLNNNPGGSRENLYLNNLYGSSLSMSGDIYGANYHSNDINATGDITSAGQIKAAQFKTGYGGIGMIGDYSEAGTTSKIIWTIGAGWTSLSNHYGIGYCYENIAGFGHSIFFADNGNKNAQISLSTGNAKFVGSVTASSLNGNGSGLSNVNADTVDGKHIWVGSQSTFASLTKDSNTMYIII
ncbi:MAG: hypothetical protein JZU53_13260 [Paludibacter sp.]|nr:hypothetical protein [Paludibacter sp.]